MFAIKYKVVDVTCNNIFCQQMSKSDTQRLIKNYGYEVDSTNIYIYHRRHGNISRTPRKFDLPFVLFKFYNPLLVIS